MVSGAGRAGAAAAGRTGAGFLAGPVGAREGQPARGDGVGGGDGAGTVVCPPRLIALPAPLSPRLLGRGEAPPPVRPGSRPGVRRGHARAASRTDAWTGEPGSRHRRLAGTA